MAIFGTVPPPPEVGGTNSQHNHSHGNVQPSHEPQQSQPQPQQQLSLPTNANGVDIEAWTVSALQSLTVSTAARGTTGVPLSIPLDETNTKRFVSIHDARAESDAIIPPPRPRSRRDSMSHREALLKGNEGTRQRRRWENDRLLHVPNVVPPEPEDYIPGPTHPVQYVPYGIAAAWDLRVRAKVEAREAALAHRKQTLTRTLGNESVPGRVPRELCQRAKKTPAVRAWVRSLEEPVRQYLMGRRETHNTSDEDDLSGSGLDSEDEEIVFVGRKGSIRDGSAKVDSQHKKARREDKGTGVTQDEGMLFDSIGDEDGGAFRRWITHSISDYYGLQSRSLFVDNPMRKVVYVCLKQTKTKTGPMCPAITHLPRPLWELC